MKIIGKITGKELSDGETWRRVVFTIDNHKYGYIKSPDLFDEKFISQFDAGNSVEVDFEKSKDGKYNNITSIKKVSADFFPANNYKGNQVSPEVWKQKDLQIARMNALTNSVSLLNLIPAKVADTKELIVLVKDIAEQLVDYIYKGKEGIVINDKNFPDY